ncbi:hypothetical protein TVAG_123040 [Trichomonas vaginalis G3]|uniref:Sphingomyelin synthase-like domain-containing protein n=1 Tax=Trichomonas vaginalis (strain ATCC PRA-98 / G3) TaxID=412133 RepID=A2DN61_TRIV3|nr:sphingomyelin synthase protein [Trichomonas vaginalis G3]EAY18238.1 hypothetical protein TVAG_123040 [Trichomonas vaginalis G3]KAI5491549.1 sphingomyelin synthase protein [Trichomonas vaginalis G3]|eukprot:XP_001579224.1 hypothetical protein [Trichomonas vaginalis G3]
MQTTRSKSQMDLRSEDRSPLVIEIEMEKGFFRKASKYSNILKTMLNVLIILIVHTGTGIALILTMAKRPALPSLPDTLQNLIPYMPYEKYVNILMLAMMVSEFIFIACDSRRWFIYRRTLAVYSLLSFLRVLTMTSTYLPDPSPNCPAIHDTTVEISIPRLWKALFGGITCGDMIYSGHTMGFMFPGLIHHRFFNKKLGVLYLVLGFIGSFSLILTRFHYTVDVLLSIILTTTMWFTYNLICEHPSLYKSLPAWLSRYFYFMEWSEMGEERD